MFIDTEIIDENGVMGVNQIRNINYSIEKSNKNKQTVVHNPNHDSPKLHKEKNEFLKAYIKNHSDEEDFIDNLSDFVKKLENASEEESLKIYKQYCLNMNNEATDFNKRDLFEMLQKINSINDLLDFLKMLNLEQEKTLRDKNSSFNLSAASPLFKLKLERFINCIQNMKNLSTKLNNNATNTDKTKTESSYMAFINSKKSENNTGNVKTVTKRKSVVYPSNICNNY